MVKLIDYTWYHAVNDQHKLNDVLAAAAKEQQQLHAIEADIIYSEAQGISIAHHLQTFIAHSRRLNTRVPIKNESRIF